MTFDLESGVRVTCDVGYLSANFGRLPRPLCSRRTDRRQTASSFIMPRLGREGIINDEPVPGYQSLLDSTAASDAGSSSSDDGNYNHNT